MYREYFLAPLAAQSAREGRVLSRALRFRRPAPLPTLTATTEFFATRYAGFPDLDSYLNGYAVTGDALANLAVPTRMIAAADDPVIPIADLADVAVTSALQIDVFPHGGHCAFLENYRLRSWLDRAVLAKSAMSGGLVAPRLHFRSRASPGT